ncbi:MAG: hypothetical protein WA151_16905, partial [Desulfatirhabdiaceae bacterium]
GKIYLFGVNRYINHPASRIRFHRSNSAWNSNGMLFVDNIQKLLYSLLLYDVRSNKKSARNILLRIIP